MTTKLPANAGALPTEILTVTCDLSGKLELHAREALHRNRVVATRVAAFVLHWATDPNGAGSSLEEIIARARADYGADAIGGKITVHLSGPGHKEILPG